MSLIVPVLIALTIGAGLFLIFFGLDTAITLDKHIEDRLTGYTGDLANVRPDKRPKVIPRDDLHHAVPGSVVAKRVNKVIAKRDFAQNLAVDLARADLKLTPGEFLILNAVSVLLFSAAAFVLSQFNPILLLPGVVVGYFAPRFWLGRRKSGRLKAFNNQLGDTIQMMANALRSGYSLLQSMQLISQEGPPPTSTEFRRVVHEVSLGVPPESALNNLVLRIRSDDLDMMVTAINVQHEVGGNLSGILETIGTTIRERVRIKGEIAVLTAQQSTAGYLIAAIPVLLAAILYVINREYMTPMFQPPWVVIPGCGIGMLAIGFFVIKKITDIKV